MSAPADASPPQDALLAVIHSLQAVVHYSPNGQIIEANQRFLDLTGYAADDVRGQHDRHFFASDNAASAACDALWAALAKGHTERGDFSRVRADGTPVWLNGAYVPVLGDAAEIASVIFLATDVTTQKVRFADLEGKMNALDQSEAVIEFAPDGTILTANANFLRTMGYALTDIQGQNHSIFVTPAHAASPAYSQFWRNLSDGQSFVDEFPRLGKDGRRVWIQASYNPVRDSDGRVVKVVKFATDISAQKERNSDIEAKMKALDLVQAVIEFETDGTIITANQNFLNAMGYELADIVGQHHRIFVDPAYAESHLYADFWRSLRQGHTKVGEYRRLGKDGRDVWIAASYNPVVDATGQITKIIKFATDVTDRVTAIHGISSMADALRDGVLSQRLKGHLNGQFAELGDALNASFEHLDMAVDQTADVAEALAIGDLTTESEGEFRGRFAELQAALNRSVAKLRDMVVNVRTSVSNIAAASHDLRVGNRHLNERTNRQAAAIEHTAATVEQMTQSVAQNAERAAQGNEVASAAKAVANDGRQVVKGTTEAMEAIRQSSDRISDIITVIDDIAFQTNLLSLNAAVEAARAGDQGRGFAVVATEVRDLSSRCAKAARQVKVMIRESVQTVTEGRLRVRATGDTFESIAYNIQEVSEIMSAIAAASQEQTTAIRDLNSVVVQLDETTQQNAALVEKSLTASGRMAEQARQLDAIMDTFRLTVMRDLKDTVDDEVSEARA